MIHDSPCPDPSQWVCMAEGRMPPEALEALIVHADRCPACRRELASVLEAEGGEEVLPPRFRALALGPPSPRMPRWSWAAAGLLVAVAAWHFRRPDPGPGSDAVQAGAFHVSERNPFLEEAVERVQGLGRSGSLAVREGSSFRVSGTRVDLTLGAIRLAARGELLTAAWPGGKVELLRGELLLSRGETEPPASPLTILLREAQAASGGVRIWVLDGEARLLLGDRSERLAAGASVCVEGDAAARRGDPPVWQGMAWHVHEGLPSLLRDGFRGLGPADLPCDYRWEAVLVRKTPESAVAVSFPAGRGGWQLPLGQGLMGAPGSPVRLAVEVRAGWVRLEVGGRELATRPASEFSGRLEPHGVPAPGLKVWGGDVEILEARWR